MNSIHRVGLAIAGVITVLAIGGALVVDGYVGALSDQTQASQDSTTAIDTPTPTDTASLDPVIVYVMPAATPPVITTVISNPAPPVVQAAPPADPTPTQQPPAGPPQPTPRPTQKRTPRPTPIPTGAQGGGPGPTFGDD